MNKEKQNTSEVIDYKNVNFNCEGQGYIEQQYKNLELYPKDKGVSYNDSFTVANNYKKDKKIN